MGFLKDNLTKRHRRRRLFGIPVQQSPLELYVYEQVLREFRPMIHWIYEVGSGSGALSIFWAVWAQLNDIPFSTIDIRPFGACVKTTLDDLGAVRWTGDCFVRTKAAMSVVVDTGLLFIDGGDKPRELREFAPLVPTGTLILCHDYKTEIHTADIAAVECVETVQPWQDWVDELPARVAVLRRK